MATEWRKPCAATPRRRTPGWSRCPATPGRRIAAGRRKLASTIIWPSRCTSPISKRCCPPRRPGAKRPGPHCLHPDSLAAASLPNPGPERLEGPEEQGDGGQSGQHRLRDLAVRTQNIPSEAVEAQVAEDVCTDGLQL